MKKDKVEIIQSDLENSLKKGNGPKFARFALSALGSIPIVGGAVAGIGGYWSDNEQENINNIFKAWLKLQQEEIEQIGLTISEVLIRLDLHDENIMNRIKSKEYSSIIKKCFKDWSVGESEEKRVLLRKLLTNAGACTIASDEVVKLFIDWIARYNEIHFKVIGTIYKRERITRYQIWKELYGNAVREDSAEADLFKLVIHDLSTGHVIRQFRPTDANGNFIKQNQRSRRTNTMILKSAFDNEKDYVLTELGKQFVHYTMNEIVPRISSSCV